MISISDDQLKTHIINNKRLLDDLVKISHLDDKWSKENFLEIEKKKCFVRGSLRYSKESCLLIKRILTLSENIFKNNELNFYTRVYPMIHLINDLSEKSNFHFDQNDNNKLFTCWLPITNNDYSPISVLKIKSKKFKKILSKLYYPNFLINDINPKPGNLTIWDGHNLHKGNLNFSNKISCAYQLKFIKSKYIYDFSIKKEFEFSLEENYKADSYQNVYFKLIDLTNELSELDNEDILSKDHLNNVIFILKKYFLKKNNIISFALSVLSQRILVNGNKFKLDKIEQNSINYDLCSIILGSENLISLDRICKNLNKKNIKSNIKNLYDYNIFNCIPLYGDEWNTIMYNNNMN